MRSVPFLGDFIREVMNRILKNCLNQYFAESGSKHLKTMYCFILLFALMQNCKQCPITIANNKNCSFFFSLFETPQKINPVFYQF